MTSRTRSASLFLALLAVLLSWAFTSTTAASPHGAKVTITGFGQVPGWKNEVFQTEVLEDGSTIVRERGDLRIWISRHHPDGSLDVGFGEGGVIPSKRFDGQLADIQGFAMQGNSLIVASGGSQRGSRPVFLQRFGPDGKPDRSFGRNGLVRFKQNTFNGEASLQTVATDAKGRIYIAGTVARRLQLTRFLSDGTLDRSFGKSGNVRLISDGGEIGIRMNDEGIYLSSYRSLWRLYYNGETDLSFDPRLPRGTSPITDFELGADGRPLVVTDKLLTLLQTDGTPDYGFGTSGSLEIPLAKSSIQLALDGSGRMLLGGLRRIGGSGAQFDDSVLLRLLSDGSPDPGFGSGGEIISDFAPGSRDRIIDLQSGPDDSVVAVGRTIAYADWDEYLARFDQAGVPDPTFGEGGRLDFNVFSRSADEIHDLARSGRKILAAGEAGGAASFARYLADGRLDRTFGGDGKVKVEPFDDRWGYAAKSVSPTAEGGLLACVYGYPAADLIKLKRNGTLDGGFGTGGILHLDGFRRCGKVKTLGGDRYMVGGRKLEGAVVTRIDGQGNFDPGYGGDGIADVPGNQIPDQLKFAFAKDGTAWVSDSRTMTKLGPDGDPAKGFGVDGTLELDGRQGRPEGSWLAGMVVGPGGSIYLADRKGRARVLKLNARGKLDPRFGKAGVAWISPRGRKFRVNDLTLGDAGQVILAGSSMRDPCPYSCSARAAWVKVSRSGHPGGLQAIPRNTSAASWGAGLSSVIHTGKQTALGGTTHTDAGGADFLLIRSVP